MTASRALSLGALTVALEFRLLGEVAVFHRRRTIDLGHARQRCVLAVLLMDATRVVPADALLDRVWADCQPRHARNALSGYVSRLRRVLAVDAGSRLDRANGGYRLVVDPLAVDLHRFRSLVAEARAAGDDTVAVDRFDQALGLWRGPALATLDTPWLRDMRTVLDTERLAATLDRNDVAFRLGRHANLLSEVATLADAHPLDERIASQLMQALYNSGRQADALRHYELVRSTLAEELGADPSLALRELHGHILNADPSLAPDGPLRATGSVEPTRPVPRQLPTPPRFFTGRDRELGLLDTALAEEHTVITVAGAGGVGKTWLALHWAYQHLDRFPDGQLFVDLRGFSADSQPMPITVAVRGFLDALGINPAQIPTDLHSHTATYRSLMANKRMLVVLDNAADSAQVLPLLPGSPTCTVLITSRHHLPELITRHTAHHLPVGILSDAEARTLLTTRLDSTRGTGEPTAVDELLEFCSGYPLALSIVASHAHTRPHVPLATLAAELRDIGLHALHDDDPGASLPTVLSWSHRALTSEQARVLGLLGIAPGPDISLRAAASLIGLPVTRARAVLRGLEQASLLSQNSHGRYRMHDLIRRHATEHASRTLSESDRQAAMRRVVDFYLHTAYAGNLLLDPHRPTIPLDPPAAGCHPYPLPDQQVATAWFATEHPCLLAAHQTAIANGWHQTTWQIAWALDTFHHRLGHLHDNLATWQDGLTATQHLGDPTARALAHRLIGRTYARIDGYQAALDHLHQALILAEHAEDLTEQTHIHLALSGAWGNQMHDRRALKHAARALHLTQNLNNPIRQADALHAMGWYTAQLGEHNQARAHCQTALNLYRNHHHRLGEAATLDSLGYIAYHTGSLTHAVHCYQQAASLFRDLGDPFGQARTHDGLGYPLVALGQREQARMTWAEALELYQVDHRTTDANRIQQKLDELNEMSRPN